jgi:hypothetical protein
VPLTARGDNPVGEVSAMRIHRYFQVSLRVAFVLITALCIFLAVKAKQIRDQKHAVAAILAAGGRIHYDDQLDPTTCRPVRATWMRRWLNQHVGSDYVGKVSAVTLYPTRDAPADEQVKMLVGIPYLRNLAIWPGGLGQLTADSSAPGGLTDEGMRYLAEHLPHLRHLSLTASTVTSGGLEHLEELDGLESLQVGSFQDQPIAGIETFWERNPQINKE